MREGLCAQPTAESEKEIAVSFVESYRFAAVHLSEILKQDASLEIL